MEKLTVGLVQMKMHEDAERNLLKASEMVGKAAGSGAEVVCLPELFSTKYFPASREGDVKPERIPGRSSELLSATARENRVVLVGGSLFEAAGGRCYNTSLIFDSRGRITGRYRKIHIPQDPYFYEKNYFSPGSRYTVVKTEKCRIGVLICFDQWYSEAARINRLMGADILFYPTAIGTVKGIEQAEGGWRDAWIAVQRGHAIANSMIVACANRTGTEGGMNFWGSSFVCDQFGKFIVKGGRREEVLIAECDLGLGRDIERGWGFLRNRMPSTYGRLVR
jgi:predicted amidohydrolase